MNYHFTPSPHPPPTGDEVNLFSLFDFLSCAEAMVLMSPAANVFKDGSNIINFVQHCCVSAYNVTRDPYWTMPTPVWHQVLYQGGHDDICQAVLLTMSEDERRSPMTGRVLMSHLFPNYDMKDYLNKKRLNNLFSDLCRPDRGGHVDIQLRTGDWVMAVKFMGFVYRVLESLCYVRTTSISIHDCMYESELDERDTADVASLRRQIARLQTKRDELSVVKLDRGASTAVVTSRLIDRIEDRICQHLDQIRDIYGDHAFNDLANRDSRSCLLEVIDSGGKGNASHITQNAGCVGQQLNNTSDRPSVGTTHITEDKAELLGFVQESFSDGLSSLGFFHHLTASRVGLTATAVATSETGYAHRRVSKCLEDLRVAFDGSVRDAAGRVLLNHFGFDTTHLTLCRIRFITMTAEEVVEAYRCPDMDGVREVQNIMDLRQQLYDHKHRFTRTFVAFDFEKLPKLLMRDREAVQHVAGIHAGTVTPVPVTYRDIRRRVAETWVDMVENFNVPCDLHTKSVYFDRMSTRTLVDTVGVCTKTLLERALSIVRDSLTSQVVVAGHPVGQIASQAFSAPLTQLQLNRFHVSGQKTSLVSGVVRVKELLNLAQSLKTPSVTVFIKPTHRHLFEGLDLVQLRICDIVTGFVDRYFEGFVPPPEDANDDDDDDAAAATGTVVCTLTVDKHTMIDRKLSPRVLSTYLFEAAGIKRTTASQCRVYHADIHDDTWWVTMTTPPSPQIYGSSVKSTDLMSSVLYHYLHSSDVIIKGVKGIVDFYTSDVEHHVVEDGTMTRVKTKTVTTLGTNLAAILSVPGIDIRRTVSNDIREIYKVFGIDAACIALEESLVDVMLASKASVSRKHIRLIAMTMCVTGEPYALTFSGRLHAHTSPLKLALFERSLDCFVSAAVSGHSDTLDGVSEAILSGQMVKLGTNYNIECIADNRAAGEQHHETRSVVPKVCMSDLDEVMSRVPSIDTELNNHDSGARGVSGARRRKSRQGGGTTVADTLTRFKLDEKAKKEVKAAADEQRRLVDAGKRTAAKGRKRKRSTRRAERSSRRQSKAEARARKQQRLENALVGKKLRQQVIDARRRLKEAKEQAKRQEMQARLLVKRTATHARRAARAALVAQRRLNKHQRAHPLKKSKARDTTAAAKRREQQQQVRKQRLAERKAAREERLRRAAQNNLKLLTAVPDTTIAIDLDSASSTSDSSSSDDDSSSNDAVPTPAAVPVTLTGVSGGVYVFGVRADAFRPTSPVPTVSGVTSSNEDSDSDVEIGTCAAFRPSSPPGQ